MSEAVVPETYLIGATSIVDHGPGLRSYLRETDQSEFLKELSDAEASGLSEGEMLCSFYAKLCYASLTTGKNENITRTRPISENLAATLAHGHGSVFEHCWFNFVTTNCSRVFTHELVRHRAGSAFSQTSGRYVRAKPLKYVFDPILEPVAEEFSYAMNRIEDWYTEMEHRMLQGVEDMTTKKKITSALRRMLPNGQANEIGWSVNIRALRHLIMMRTSRHAEWEIRKVFNDVYLLMSDRYPLMFADAKTETVNGLVEVTGMKMQPYEQRIDE